MQSNPVWVGDLGNGPKNQSFDGSGLKIAIFFFLFYSFVNTVLYYVSLEEILTNKRRNYFWSEVIV
jgi:hypothetical protein